MKWGQAFGILIGFEIKEPRAAYGKRTKKAISPPTAPTFGIVSSRFSAILPIDNSSLPR